jgi:hypothetical protein
LKRERLKWFSTTCRKDKTSTTPHEVEKYRLPAKGYLATPPDFCPSPVKNIPEIIETLRIPHLRSIVAIHVISSSGARRCRTPPPLAFCSRRRINHRRRESRVLRNFVLIDMSVRGVLGIGIKSLHMP